ncbi:MAG: dienelactone hydrolase family protein [Proteobacteria bacterium]|nr:dienelactone hydrolase family protein [Pseudomonadota bacterium]
MRLLLKLSLVVVAVLAGSLPGPASAKPEDFRAFVQWFVPAGVQKPPLVILIEGSGGTRPNARNAWVDWLNARGIAVAQVRSAAARGRADWSGVGCSLQYNGDARDVLDLARAEQPAIDSTRFALMGFSRGGTEVLNSARTFRGAPAGPTAVFAFYPGCAGSCTTDYAKDGPTPVQILYGDADDWGQYQDTFGQCRRLAGGRIAFHVMPGAHHGFDNRSSGSFTVASRPFRYQPSAEATAQAQAIVWQTLAPAWGLRN